jgi:hypothetical protein
MSTVIVGNHNYDITGHIDQLYVYCDVVENVAVGDTLAPLLRIVDAKNLRKGYIHEEYNPPRYLPLQKKAFDTVDIYIMTDYGSKVPFESGKAICTLHFRKAAASYFL